MEWELVEQDGETGIKHLKCGMTSFNPNDIERKYCGKCHRFLEQPSVVDFEDTIICPWCGHRVDHGDLFEFDDGEDDCVSCGKPIEVTIHYSPPTYTTRKMEK